MTDASPNSVLDDECDVDNIDVFDSDTSSGKSTSSAHHDDPERVTSTCTEHIARVCVSQCPTHSNSQLCLVSLGFDVEGVAAEVVRQHAAVNADRHFLIVIPDRLPQGTVESFATALADYLGTKCSDLAGRVANPAGCATGADGTSHRDGGGGDDSAGTGDSLSVTYIDEGAGTKERCTAFQRRGVIVASSRLLCADLLHRRLSSALVAVVVVVLPYRTGGGTGAGAAAACGRMRIGEVITPSLLFCVEIFLREGAATPSSASAAVLNGARVMVLSDHPLLTQYLVQRHHAGLERFTEQFHIGDVQLFPRFRLGLMRHFERVAKEKLLAVDRVVVRAGADVCMLDELLVKVLLEVLSELQTAEQRLVGMSSGGGGGAKHSRASEVDLGMEEFARFQPRARPQCDAASASSVSSLHGHLSYYGARNVDPAGDSTSGPIQAALAEKRPSAAAAGSAIYVRKPWRRLGTVKALCFAGITNAACLHVEHSDLDIDLHAALHANEPRWPYRALVESLLDVRWLRRVARRGSSFDFLLALESSLEKRSGKRDGLGGAPPAAMWTLSSHYNDIVTIASHRIGSMTVVGATANVFPGSFRAPHVSDTAGEAELDRMPDSHLSGERSAGCATVVDCDVDDEDRKEEEEGEEVQVVSAGPPSASPQVILIPNKDDINYILEVVHRLAAAWCRDTQRRLRKHMQEDKGGDGTTNAGLSSPPALLVVVYSQKELLTCVQRLLSSLQTFQQLQLSIFLRKYQARYGVRVASATPAGRLHCGSSSCDRGTSAQHGREDVVQLPSGGNEDGSAAQSSFEQWMQATNINAEDEEDDDSLEEVSPEEGEEGGLRHAEVVDTVSGGATQGRSPGALFSQSVAQIVAAEGGSRGSTGRGQSSMPSSHPPIMPACSLHHVLLSQSPLTTTLQHAQRALEVSFSDASKKESTVNGDSGGTAADGGASKNNTINTREVPSFLLESVGGGMAILCPRDIENANEYPHVVVVDGNQLSVSSLASMVRGTHDRLHVASPPSSGEEEPSRQGQGEAHRTVRARLARVQRIIFSQQRLQMVRMLEMLQDELSVAELSGLKAQLVVSSLTDEDFANTVADEREAFESLAHVKASLTGQLLAGRSSLRKTEDALRSGLALAHSTRRRSMYAAHLKGKIVMGNTAFDGQTLLARGPPVIVFDEREFRCPLPYALYCQGIEVVPLTLATADYVLSSSYAVERKGVRDYVQSLQSGRIFHQLAAMSRKYARPICLIEFSKAGVFRLTFHTDNSPRSLARSGNKGTIYGTLYARTARLMAAFPRVSFMWSRSPAHSAAMLMTLKRTVATDNVAPNDPSLTSTAIVSAEEGTSFTRTGDRGSGDLESGGAGSAADRELAHYAARVLSRFPGVTPGNAPRVMQMCGSLAGLATVSQESLENVMELKDAKMLYEYLHSPFSVDVG